MLTIHDGRPFQLQPHQQFIVGSLSGWRRAEDPSELRFKVMYGEIAKGDGKTPTLAGLGLKGAIFEGVAEAQVYCAATKKEQAMILFSAAVGMAERSPEIRRRVKFSGQFPSVWSIAHPPSRSFFRPIASEGGQSGPRIYRALVDELHEHTSSTVLDLMRAGMKVRNAQLLIITNSGWDRTSVCWREHEYTVKVLEGSLQDDARFGFIAGLDACPVHLAEGRRFPAEACADCDDWQDEEVWPKACPNIGITIDYDYVRAQVTEAIGMPSKANEVKRLHFGIWTEQLSTWIPAVEWAACGRPELVRAEALLGRRCFAGLDLGWSDDLSALMLVFPPLAEAEPWQALAWFWCPQTKVFERREKDRLPYDRWVEAGLIEATPGNVTDYGRIRARVNELAQEYDLIALGIDPWNGRQLSTELADEDGLPASLFPQGVTTFSPAMKEVERLIRMQLGDGRGLAHDGNEVLAWQMGNVAPYENAAGERKIDKKRSREKVDGPNALCMALALATATADDSTDDVGVTIL
jgi:phage terminase large subunit-like protein